MNRGDLVRMTANQAHLPITTTEVVLAALIECLTLALAAGEDVRLKGFGTFEHRARPAVIRKNPRTGDEMEIDPRATVSFLPGVSLKGRLNP